MIEFGQLSIQHVSERTGHLRVALVLNARVFLEHRAHSEEPMTQLLHYLLNHRHVNLGIFPQAMQHILSRHMEHVVVVEEEVKVDLVEAQDPRRQILGRN